MLKFSNKKKKILKIIKSGLFFDFFIKKISDIFVRNVLIHSSLFFGEKYLIEVLTKKIFSDLIFKFNLKLGLTSIQYKYFFLKMLYFIFLSLFSINLYLIFFF